MVYLWLYASGRPHEFRIGELNAPGISVKQLRLIYLQDPDIKRVGGLSLGTSEFSSHTVRTTDRRRLSTLYGEDNCQNEREREKFQKKCESTCSGLDQDFPDIFYTVLPAPLTLFVYSRTNILSKELMKLRGTRSRQTINCVNDTGNILLRRTNSSTVISFDTGVAPCKIVSQFIYVPYIAQPGIA